MRDDTNKKGRRIAYKASDQWETRLGSSVREDPYVASLLKRVPAESRNTFTDEQLRCLKLAFGSRKQEHHALDMRGTLGLFRWRYYYVILAGRERRHMTRRERIIVHLTQAILFLGVAGFFFVWGFLFLYYLKSELGLDLLPGLSLSGDAG